MVQSLQLGPAGDNEERQGMRRLNRLPVIIAIALVILFLGIVFMGMSLRGSSLFRSSELDTASGRPATNFGDQLKRGVSDGIIGEPDQADLYRPKPIAVKRPEPPISEPASEPVQAQIRQSQLEPEAEWRARMKREQDEQVLREAQRQRMAHMQAKATALDAPMKIDVSELGQKTGGSADVISQPTNPKLSSAADLYSAAMKAGLAGQNADPNGQASKESFFNQDIKDLGYLPNSVVPQFSKYELKRGSVIPATLITGLNSDLPGRLTAQVSQNVYDSATGYRVLIPQGAKLFGRYDSKVSFGQERVLVVWTDLIFPNGSTLQLGGMAGTDAEGYGGFSDKVNRHLLRTFGSAALVAIIGTGIDLSMPAGSTLSSQETASDAARRNFAESFGRVAEQTISKSLNVQPTIEIRPGYKFNVLVDQDIIFPSEYRGG